MINSHKEIVESIRHFVSKFEFINDFTYLKDIDGIVEEISISEPRTLVLGLDSVEFDEVDYNTTLTYLYAIADETMDDIDSIIESETENIFCVSALSDYLNHINESPVEMERTTMSNSVDKGTIYTTVSGSFSFIIKTNPSYWKKMEEYNV